MNWLIWKEYRENRLIVVTALALLVFPYALTAFTVWRGWARPRVETVLMAACYSLGLLQLTMALAGGNAIAGERVDRSAEFMAQLPVSRGRKLAGKLLAVLILAAMAWLPNLLVLSTLGAGIVPAGDLWPILGTMAAMGLTFFSLAWLFSAMLESPTFSVCAGLLLPMLVFMAVMGVVNQLELKPFGERIYVLHNTICLVLAALSFTLGTVYYLRRVEP